MNLRRFLQIQTFITLVFFCSFVATPCSTAIASEQSIHALRSAYLYYFSHFITWPKETPFLQDSLNLCTLTDNSEDKFQLNTINNKPLGINKLKIILFDRYSEITPQSLANCHIIYTAESFNVQLFQHQDKLPIYTLVVTEGDVANKGFIHLYRKSNKLKFEIENEQLVDAGFRVSSKLLRLAKQQETP